MPLDPQIRAVLDAAAAAGAPPLSELPPQQARSGFREMTLAGLADLAPEPVAQVDDGTLAGVPVRTYDPGMDGAPTTVYFHGGGWVIGDLDTHDPQCRRLANAARTRVVAVDYRLAPEHPYPAALDDAYAVTCAVAAERGAVAVAGDSAGGNLAAAVALRARDEDGPAITTQLLVYPALDPTLTQPSVTENGEGYFLTKAGMEWFVGHYLPDRATRTEAYAGPLHAPDLAGLPPAVVATAEFDPLRDEGDAYARRLADAGVAVVHLRHPGLVHGFAGMAALVTAAAEARDRVFAEYGAVLHATTG